jgi:hypothetical protein
MKVNNTILCRADDEKNVPQHSDGKLFLSRLTATIHQYRFIDALNSIFSIEIINGIIVAIVNRQIYSSNTTGEHGS